MVALPGSLERSTLGDLLGALHRDRVTGALCLRERADRDGPTHVIHFEQGLISEIESERGSARLEANAHHARLERLEALFALSRARVSFRVRGSRPRHDTRPLEPPEFLHGRRRFRDAERARTEVPRAPMDRGRAQALAVLGLGEDASRSAVNEAFRRLARRWHPDRHPHAGAQTRAALCRHFARISLAYRELTSSP